MADTPNRVNVQNGLVELQQTAEMRAVMTEMDVGDDDSWFDITKMVKSFSPGSPGDRAVSQEYNASQVTAMTTRSQQVPNHSPQLVLYDTKGIPTDHGLTNNFDLGKLVRLCNENDLPFPLRWATRGSVGDNMHTYVNNYVIGSEDQGIDTGQNQSAVLTVRMTADDRTEALIT